MFFILFFLLSFFISEVAQADLCSGAFLKKNSGNIHLQQIEGWLSYKRAKALVRKKGFKNRAEFRKWITSSSESSNIPFHPDRVYQAEWEGWAEFLGAENKSGPSKEGWLSYKKAKALIQKEGLKNQKEFKKWSASSVRPLNFPSAPDRVYAEKWEGWRVFLGTEWLSYEEAKIFVQKKALKNRIEFKKWIDSASKTLNIPSRPDKVYQEEWEGWAEFLGTIRKWMPYEEAQALMREKGIQSSYQFREWSKSGDRPPNFPSAPDRIYQAEWENWRLFLGNSK